MKINNFNLFIWFLWQLPQNLIAFLMMPFVGKMKLIRFENYTWAFECPKMIGGVSLGNFVFLSPSCSNKETSIRHEYGHVMQSHLLGWLYLFIIGIPSMLNAMFSITDCYYDFYTESWANKLSGLKVAKNQYGCYLFFPNKNKIKINKNK